MYKTYHTKKISRLRYFFKIILMIWDKKSLIVVADMFKISHKPYGIFISEMRGNIRKIMIFTPGISIIKSDIHIILVII